MTSLPNRDIPEAVTSIAIIGGGFSGIASGYYLKRAKLNNFTIFEASAGPGGTWYDNRYPGAQVDTPSHLYCFSFNTFNWSCTHARDAELRTYLEKTVDEFKLGPHFRFNTTVRSVIWSNEEDCYRLTFADGTTQKFYAVLACVGFLNVPYIPPWVDGKTYQGLIVHTAKWPAGLTLDGKRVGVIGTGSSAVQVVSEASKVAKHVTVFQRSPNWVLPKNDRDFSPEERKKLRTPWRYRLKYAYEYYKYDKVKTLGEQEQPGSKTNLRMKSIAEAHLKRSLAGRPDLISALTPDFPFYGKRPVISDTYYSALCRDNVELAPAVSRVDSLGVVDVCGQTHELDLVVLATGFQAASYLARLEVKGPGGHDLQATWAGEPAAYLGCCVPGFPNFFMMYGPNSNAGPVVFMLECQAKFAVDNIAEMTRRRSKRVEVRKSAFGNFNAWLQQRLETSVFKSTKNYFSAASGKIVTQWPFSATRFWWISRIGRSRAMKFE